MCTVTAFVVYTSQTAFHFFSLYFLSWRTPLYNVTRASFSHITQSRKIQLLYEQNCATHLTAFYGCIATMLGSDTNLYPTDHTVFEPSNNQQWKHSICSLISCFLASKPSIVLDPGAPDSSALTRSCLDYKAKWQQHPNWSVQSVGFLAVSSGCCFFSFYFLVSQF